MSWEKWKTTDRQKIKSNFSPFLGFIFESMTSALPSPEDLEQRKFIESFSVFHSNVTIIVIDFINCFSNFTELFLLAITNNLLQRPLFMCFSSPATVPSDSNFSSREWKFSASNETDFPKLTKPQSAISTRSYNKTKIHRHTRYFKFYFHA